MKFEFDGRTFSFYFEYRTHIVQKQLDPRSFALHAKTGGGLPFWAEIGAGANERLEIWITRTCHETICHLQELQDGIWVKVGATSAWSSSKDQFKRATGREKAISRFKKSNPYMNSADGFERGMEFYRAMRQAWASRFTPKVAAASK